MPLWAQHSSAIVEYFSNLEKLKHIIGSILEGVHTLITSARVFAHANARVRVQVDLDLFRAHMTEWRLLKAELEMVNGCRQEKKEAWEIFIKHTWTCRRGVHIYVSKDGSTHTGRKKMQKHENTCVHFKVVMRRKKNLSNKQTRKRAALRPRVSP